MFEVTVNTRRAVVGTKELITTSSAGIQCQFTFSEDWDSLSKIAIFRNGDDANLIPVAVPNSNLVTIPAQSCSEDFVDEPLFVGVYGTDGLGAVIIPTVWTSLGVLRPGAVTTDIITPPEPTPDMWAQILAIANEAAAIADECEANETLRAAAEELRASAESLRATAEQARADAEAQRAAAEQVRSSSELTRQSQESDRVEAEILRAQAEVLRQQNETIRATAETERASAEQMRQTNEATRASNEAARVTAEQNRASAETQRASAESSRVTEETSRVSAESSRATAEQDRASAETARASAESQRVTAENNRVSAEQNRVNAEDERVQAETDRAAEFANWEGTIASKVPNTRTVNGKALSTDITLDAGDIGYDSTETYQAGSVGAELQEQTRQISDETTGLDSKAPVILETASGAIASFSDGADSMPIRKLVAQIEPVQDLHGYDSPWPGGGMGNLAYDVLYQGQVSITWGGVTLSIKDGKWRLVGTALYNGGRTDLRSDPFLLKAGTYNISNDVQIADIILQKASDNSAIVIANIDSRTFTLEEDTNVFIGVNMVQGTTYNADIALLLNAGSTKGTWYPYSNICPISGWTGAEIPHTGVNIWDEETVRGYIDDDGVFNTRQDILGTKNAIHVKPNTTYYFKKSVQGLITFWERPYSYDSLDRNYFISRLSMPDSVSTFTTPDNCYAIHFNLSSAYGNTYNNNISINYPATNTEYHPYTGDQISVTFPETIYGGSDEVIGGALADDSVKVMLSEFTWRAASNGLFFAYLGSTHVELIKLPDTLGDCNIMCNKYNAVSYGFHGSDQEIFTTWVGSVAGNIIYVNDSRFTTLADFTASITDDYIIAKRATPVEYALTPAELTTLLGQNNVWTDVGDVSVDYPADTKLYIDNKITTAIANALNA